MSDAVKVRKAEMIPTDSLHPNPWNPNKETDEKFQALVDEIHHDGFDEPLQVVPCSCEDQPQAHYMIIGGEHRWRAALKLNMKALPCHVYKEWSEDVQKLKTVRRNMLHGSLDDAKFTVLVHSLDDKYDRDTLAHLMAFEKRADMDRYILEQERERKQKQQSVVEKFMDEAKREEQLVDGLTDIINNLLANYGDTVENNFIFFPYKGKVHLMVVMDANLLKEIKALVKQMKETKGDISEHLATALKAAREGDDD